MLQFLRIKNLALLEEVSIDFENGFTAVTGETGAGKSILLGALRLLSGSRAGKELIRHGADACEVEAALYFEDRTGIESLLEEAGLPECEDGVLLLKRVIHRDKAGRIMVNGSLTTLANLQLLGALWIDFHGPEDPQRLFEPAFQLELLDLYAKDTDIRATYARLFSDWKNLRAERESIVAEGQLSEEEIEFYRRQIEKIDQCEVSEESIDQLERLFGMLGRAQETMEAARALADGLIGDQGVFFQIGQLQRLASGLEEADPSTRAVSERLASIGVEAEDLGQEVARLVDKFDFEPEEIERVTARMNLWQELRRKMGGSVATVLQKRRELLDRVEQQSDIEGTLARLDRMIEDAENALRKTSGDLRKARENAAERLTGEVARAISTLGFSKAGFEVKVVGEEHLSSNGGSRCEFLFAPNAGQELMPLQKIASSGEIARVMLAIKTVLAGVDSTPVLVFDEVDANVGGEIGRIVGQRMAALGERHQVFCVTHLPQVASLAQSHLVVEKQQSNGRTEVMISPIHGSHEERVDELARMLGDRRAGSARAHAERLLQ